MGFLSLLAPDSYNHQIDTYVATKISDVARHRLALGGGGDEKSAFARRNGDSRHCCGTALC